MSNLLNFSGGPGALPLGVLQKASEAIVSLQDTGVSLLGMSHRSDWYQEINAQAQNNIRRLLSIPNDYEVLFLQGGASLQFAMIAMNFLMNCGKKSQYIDSGYWSAKAPIEARPFGEVEVIWCGKEGGYRSLPTRQELDHKVDPKACYLHYVSNETVEGLTFLEQNTPETTHLICDMSSDLLSKPIDVSRYALIYAHAQKNLGPAGVNVVIMRKEMLLKENSHIPPILSYQAHSKSNSILNTPPVFSIYVLKLVTDWLLYEVGGLEKMASINQAKAACVYKALDENSNFFQIHAHQPYRSMMNVAFSLGSAQKDSIFLDLSQKAGFVGLEGHRSIGGLRASLYNAVSLEACEKLAHFVREFDLK